MKLRKVGTFLMAMLFMLASVGFPLKASASAKRRVAVLPFEYGAVTSEVGTVDVGKGITTLLITKLVNDGTYSVIDRQMLDSILKEQNLSVSDRADPATACKIGKILSVDAIIVGTVTQFGFENKSMGAGAAVSVLSHVPYGGFASGLGGIRKNKSKVKVAIDARVVDTNTTEILAAVHGTGESNRSGMSLWGDGGGSGGGGGGGFDFGSSGFATSIAGEATMAAVEEMGGQIIAMANKLPDNQSLAQANVEGKIADVTGNQVIVNVGKNNGIASGDKLVVNRAYKTVKDPVSGKVLKELTNTIAVINVSSVDPDSSTGEIVKGGGARVGDSVKKVTTEVSGIVIAPAPGSSSSLTGRAMEATGTVVKKGEDAAVHKTESLVKDVFKKPASTVK
ncbi:MAG TPA: CsgG/HfaB family protein [Drouetiella sp.]